MSSADLARWLGARLALSHPTLDVHHPLPSWCGEMDPAPAEVVVSAAASVYSAGHPAQWCLKLDP